jgi:serine/threonine protein kinase
MKAGQQVTPTLRLTRLLGKGGMGSVWLADHLTLGSQVAIKFMATANLEDQTLLQRFSTEAKAAAQIKHPHVAQVFDHGVMPDGVPYIVMEYLEGEDLKHAVRRGGPLPLVDLVRVVAQSAKALGRAHSLGIVHRDIKPDNIFLCNIDGETFVKLLDFGVAKVDQGAAMNGATTTGSMMGTPLYMSPEQLLSARTVNFKSDLWSLAVVAYFALTGRVPFMGETIGSLSVAVHTGIFAPPTSLRPDLPPSVDAWFARMLKRDPNERYGSAKEMAEAFEQAAMTTSTRNLMSAIPLNVPLAALPPPNSVPSVNYPPALSQSAPSSTIDPAGLIAMPQPTFSGTASDAGRRNAATKKQLVVAAALSGGLVLTVGIIAVVMSSGSSDATGKPEAASQPDKPVVQAVSALPTPTTPVVVPASTTTAEAPGASASAATKSAPDKPTAEKTSRVVTPPPTTPPTTKTGTGKPPPKDTIGF